MTPSRLRTSFNIHGLHTLVGVRMKRTVITLGVLAALGAGMVPVLVESAIGAQVNGNLARAEPCSARCDARSRARRRGRLAPGASDRAARRQGARGRRRAFCRADSSRRGQLLELERAHALLAASGTPAPADVTAVADAIRRGDAGRGHSFPPQRLRPGEPIALAVHTWPISWTAACRSTRPWTYSVPGAATVLARKRSVSCPQPSND